MYKNRVFVCHKCQTATNLLAANVGKAVSNLFNETDSRQSKAAGKKRFCHEGREKVKTIESI